ncbi:MAG TPA: tetratricopeptide repeat protein [Terracidiphilus sp.]|nr:tetratricopeptide repeat protein [Terracidiphilus sp.]
MALGPQSSKVEPTIRFGRDFELEPELYELRRSGRALKLERIPMEILLLLVRQRGRVVGRQQIADCIWGEGVSLDVDNSINGAIRKIRQVLRDDPERPRFIQTVTGRGYRFISPVMTQESPVENPAAVEAVYSDRTATAERPAQSPGDGLRRDEAAETWAAGARIGVQASGPSRFRSLIPSRFRWSRVVLPIAIAAIAVAAFLFWRWKPQHEAMHVRLAVLPFQNLTGDASQDYLSDGFTEEMITQLGALDPTHLAVIARTSVMSYKDTRIPLRQIAGNLGVQYVLEGSVRRDSDRLRITAQLIRAQDQTHVWAQEYDRAPNDLLAIQSEIAREIADEIQLTLNGARRTQAMSQSVLTPQAYEAHDDYLKGRYLWSKRTRDGLAGSIYWFNQAIGEDPKDARAYAGLADSYAMLSGYGFVPADVYMQKARTAALKALDLDDSLAEAHTSFALIAENYEWDWKTAEREFRRAIQLNANYATAHQWFAECLAFEGRFDEAILESERARQLDPLSTIILADNGAIYLFARQYDRAIARLKGVLDVDPENGRAHLIIEAYVQEGRYKDALDVLEQWRSSGDGPWISAFAAYIYGRSGETAKARQAMQRVEEAIRHSSEDPTPLLSVAYAGLADKEKWLADLDDALARRSNLPTCLKVDPLYDPLRGDRRFRALLRRAGLN